MRYIQFDETGHNAFEAPYQKTTMNGTIYGYNKPGNQAMLLADGWIRDENTCPLSWLYLLNGEIHVAEPIIPVVLPSIFSKLQIRRCLRRHGYEGQLNTLIASNEIAKNEWADAQEINLYDETIQAAITSGLIPSGWIQIIQSELSGSNAFAEQEE